MKTIKTVARKLCRLEGKDYPKGSELLLTESQYQSLLGIGAVGKGEEVAEPAEQEEPEGEQAGDEGSQDEVSSEEGGEETGEKVGLLGRVRRTNRGKVQNENGRRSKKAL